MRGCANTSLSRSAALAAVAALLALTQAATAGASVLRGEVRDTTCYGPCIIDGPPPPLYGGDDAAVTIFARGELAVAIASQHANGGRFRFRLEPGRYLVRVRITSDRADQWSSDTSRFRVRRGETAQVTLAVANEAIV